MGDLQEALSGGRAGGNRLLPGAGGWDNHRLRLAILRPSPVLLEPTISSGADTEPQDGELDHLCT